jgi:hypothetical protein
MKSFTLEPLHIGDYVALSLIFLAAFGVGLAALVSFLIQGSPDPELEHYADDARPAPTMSGVPHV